MSTCVAGSALQALSADEEVEEKEFEGSRLLRSSLKIKSKPKMKHQMGTYRRGRKLGKNPPASNEAQLLSASQLNGRSLSDVADHIASEDFIAPDDEEYSGSENGSPRGAVQQSEGTVLAPSDPQQQVGGKTQSRPTQSADRNGSAQSESATTSNRNSLTQNGSAQSAGLSVGKRASVGQSEVEAKGKTEPDASSPLASRDAGEQAAACVSELASGEPEGKGLSLMW